LAEQADRKPILTVCPESYPGTTSVLKHYNVTGLVDHSDEISPNTVEGRKMVNLGGWNPIYYEAMQRINSAGVPIGIFWTSSVGQMDFSNSGVEVNFVHLITDLVRSGMVDMVFGATPSVVDFWQKAVGAEHVTLLPYAFDWEESQNHINTDIPVGDDWVDLFCPADTRKNVLVQTHAAAIADVNIHYSGLKPKYRWFAELIGAKFTDMGWMSKDIYYKAVQGMKLGLQVTYAETFDYVVAEHFAMKRPCLISTVMGSWVDKKLWKDLMVHNLDDPIEVADLISNVMDMTPRKWKSLNTRCHNFMKAEADRRNVIGLDVLTKVIE